MPDDTSSPLRIEIDQAGDVLRIAPHGDVDLSTSPALRKTLQSHLSTGDGQVVIDLAGVPYMDSSGVATLVEALQTCKHQQRELVLARPNDRVASIFKISRLDSVFTILNDLEG